MYLVNKKMLLFNCMYMYPEYENKHIIIIIIDFINYLFERYMLVLFQNTFKVE